MSAVKVSNEMKRMRKQHVKVQVLCNVRSKNE